MSIPRFILLVLLCIFPWSLWAQIGDLTNDTGFFKEQLKTYQNWLDKTGLGETLQVYEISVEPDELSIYLSFPFEDIDTILVAWRKLKQAFEQKRSISLERQLFYKAIDLMEVRQSLANVQIYDTYDLRKEPLFFRGIYFEDGNVKIEESNPRSEIREIYLKPPNFEGMKEMSVEVFNEKYDRQVVFENIYNYAKTRYERTVCEYRNPRVRLIENDEVLRFEVADLCREVLTDSSNPLLCQMLRRLNYECNWAKRELLKFTITYKSSERGFQLGVEVNGKYGSGMYNNVGRGGYLNMEIDFDEYLKRYADEFTTSLKRIVLK